MALPNADFGAVFACISFAHDNNASKTGFSCSSRFSYRSSSAVIYSLIETAKENGLDPYRYLLWVLQNAPQLSETDETWPEKLLPARAPKDAICLINKRPPSR